MQWNPETDLQLYVIQVLKNMSANELAKTLSLASDGTLLERKLQSSFSVEGEYCLPKNATISPDAGNVSVVQDSNLSSSEYCHL